MRLDLPGRYYGLRLMPLLIWMMASSAAAHPLAPSLLELRARPAHRFDVRWKTPLVQPAGVVVQPALPPRCRPLEAPVSALEGTGAVTRWTVDCGPAGLAGARLGVSGLEQSGTDALVRVQLEDGTVLQTLLTGATPGWTVPRRQGRLEVAGRYLDMGLEHLLTGADHLLMVLGLLCLVRGRRALVVTLTAFTAGHSVTLALAALGVVSLPAALIEPAIAGTLLLVALELTREAPSSGPSPGGQARPTPGALDARGEAFARTRSRRRSARPWTMAFVFGLLHGLGFAGALLEVGLPPGEVPVALVAFNTGLEAGQLAVVAALVGTWRLVAPVISSIASRPTLRLARVPAYVIGTLAVYWILERTAGG